MPMSHSHAQALPGTASGSRKRSHAEITKSESRSQSPHPPPKRRRTLLSPPPRSFHSPQTTPHSLEGSRFLGDGLDHRRPTMSTPSTSQTYNHDTIDLTLDDESPTPSSPSTTFLPPNSSTVFNDGLRTTGADMPQRAPPFGPHDGSSQAVIDLSSDDEDWIQAQGEGGTRLAPSSPEVQFIAERARPQSVGGNNQHRRRPHLPPPPAMGHFGNMANFLRDMTQNMFFNFRGNDEIPEEALNRIDGLFYHHGRARNGEEALDDFDDEFNGLQMDHTRAAFNIGQDFVMGDIVALPPRAEPIRADEPAYKEPPPVQEGFTRNYDEDDMLVCGRCGDELATGPTEQKQEVWIVKQCGHAYCGDCAHNRNAVKSKNNKDPKRPASQKPSGFKICAIRGCKKPVDGKAKMFQIYL